MLTNSFDLHADSYERPTKPKRFSWTTTFAIFSTLLLSVCVVPFQAFADENFVRSEAAIVASLPSGWSVVEHKSDTIPWGHNWCDRYDGVKGSSLTLGGISPTFIRYRTSDGEWQQKEAGVEAIDVWMMSGSYREAKYFIRCAHRPMQPTLVFENTNVRIFARPSSYSAIVDKVAEREFMRSITAIESIGPWHDPERLSWKTWVTDMKVSLTKQLGK